MPRLFSYANPWSGASAPVRVAPPAATRDIAPVPVSGINDPKVPIAQALINLGDGITVGGSGLAELPAVNLDNAVRVSAVYRAVSLIAGSLSTLPLKLYEQAPDGARRAVEPPENAAVWWQPNPEMDLPTFYKTSFAHNAMAGNTYWYLVDDALGNVAEIWPVHPKRVRIGRDRQTGWKMYEIDGELPQLDAGYGGQMVHLPNLSIDGRTGLNPVAFARMSLQLSRATEEYGARTFANGSTPLGVLQTEADLSEEQADKLARMWEKHHRGFRNANRIAIIDNNAKYQPISINPQDAQFLETRRFQVQEIARLFGVPPHLLADSSNSTSWGSGLEEQTRAMITFTFADYTNRFEYALSRRVMRRPGRYAKFDYRAFVRGSFLQRMQGYVMGIQNGIWTRNEVRAWEDLDPGGEELDAFLTPLNLGQVGEGSLDPSPDASSARMDELQRTIDELKARLDTEAA